MENEQKQSGLTVKAWCRENGISENCFYYRQHNLRQRIGSALSKFVEIKPSVKTVEIENLENQNCVASIYAGGITVTLSNQSSGELIWKIMKALQC